MNWSLIITAVLPELINLLKTTSATTPTPVTTSAKPSETVKMLQQLLNQFVQPNPPLAEDGWLGPKTDQALQAAITKLQLMLGKL